MFNFYWRNYTEKLMVSIASAVVTFILAAPQALATPIEFGFSAILDTSGPKPTGVSTGDVLTGNIVFDFDEIANQFNDADDGTYSFNPGASSFSFSVSGFTRSAELKGILISNASYDTIEFIVELPTQEAWSIRLQDASATAWDTTFLETIPLATLTDLTLFSDNPSDKSTFLYGDYAVGGNRLGAEISALSAQGAANVPEPGTLVLLLVGLFACALMRLMPIIVSIPRQSRGL